MAISIDLNLDQGTVFTATLPPVTDATGAIVNLTGFTVSAAMSRSYSSNPLYVVNIPATVSNAASGLITLALDEITTLGLFPTRYIYDVQIIDGSGNKTRVFDGLITVYLSVVRS